MFVGTMLGVVEPESRITVQGEGVVVGAPDLFVLDVSVVLMDKELEPLRNEVSDRCHRLVTAARAFELDAERTVTREFTIQPRFDNQQKFLGYFVTQKFRLALANLEQAEALTTAVLKAGATTIESAEFTVKESEELWEEARDASVADTFKKAKRMTAVLDSKPGRPLRIVDQGNQLTLVGCAWSSTIDRRSAAKGGGFPIGDHAHFVAPTAVKFQVRVQVDFSIEPLKPEPTR
jgi:uncharacterized protein YggE